jgi:phage I-like protein
VSTRILNSDFQPAADGFSMIEKLGEFPNARANVVQIIDAAACESIVNRFNAAAAAPNFPGMLIDIEHFKHDQSKETRAYGWLMRLQNRADGIYGKIRWTDTGKAAVDGGSYRYFSTEYAPASLQILNSGNPRRVRPLALDGLTLTNVPNNKGQTPITNRTVNTPSQDAFALSEAAKESSNSADSPMGHFQAMVKHKGAELSHRALGNDKLARFHRSQREYHEKLVAKALLGDTANNPLSTKRNPMNSQTSDELIVNREKIESGISDLRQQNPKLGYADARNRLRGLKPALFGCDARTAAPVITNSALPQENRDERNAFVQSVQSGRPGMAFSDAWNQARGLRPHLFITP